MRLTAVEIATRQLERAVELHLDARDHVSAITLASAAGEILAQIRARMPAAATGAALTEGAEAVGRRWQRFFERKDLVEIADGFRTGLRGLQDGGGALDLDASEVARDVLERAIDAYIATAGQETEAMRRFSVLLSGSAPQP